MYPASSVSGFYFAHPEAKYFGVGVIGRDQVEDYARRKGFTIALVEKWNAPSLAYDPDKIVLQASPVAEAPMGCGCGTSH